MQIFVFVNGAGITALEIIASRILAPYFGTSLPVWGSIIGITMIALAIGYILGGRVADQKPSLPFLATLTLIAGIIACLIPLAAKPFLSLLLDNLINLKLVVIFGSLIGATALFAIPIVIMGMVSPFAIKIATSKNPNKIGAIAGSLYGLATIGSILGVFLPAFVLVPLVGSKAAIVFFAFLEILISLIAMKKTALLPILILPITILFTNERINGGNLYEAETPYQYLQVVKSEGIFKLKFNEGLGVQSIYDPKRILKTDRYWDYSVLLPYFQPERSLQKMAIIGAAGATIATNIRDHVQDIKINITGLEIDPQVISIGKKYFHADQRALKYQINDGRLGLKQLKEKQDIIFIDAYSQAQYIPPHLATKEFFEETRDKLTEDGFVAANVNSISPESPLLQSIATTVNQVYPFVWHIHIPETYNYLVFGSADPDLFDNLKPNSKFDQLYRIAMANLTVYDQKSLVLTDDRAPLELMTDWEIYLAMKARGL